jgi:hypothetical protein
VALRYLLVDEHWTHVGEYEASIPDWSVGQEFFTADGRRFAIVGIVPSVDPDSEFAATWTVEPA